MNAENTTDLVQSIMLEVFKYADLVAPLSGPPMTQAESLPIRQAAFAQDRVLRSKLFDLFEKGWEAGRIIQSALSPSFEDLKTMKCPECLGFGETCLAGHSAHPDNWRKCPQCAGVGKIDRPTIPEPKIAVGVDVSKDGVDIIVAMRNGYLTKVIHQEHHELNISLTQTQR